jgi:hypothetical protein
MTHLSTHWLAALARTVLAAGAAAVLAATPAHAAKPAKPPVQQAAEDAFWIGDFAALERQNDDIRHGHAIAPDGSSRLDDFRRGLTAVFENDVDNAEAYLSDLDALTLRWAQEHPTSAFAHVLHVHELIKHAWSYRGGSYARDVAPEAMNEFVARMQQALDYFKAHADVELTDSYAHEELLEIGRALIWSRAQLQAVANDGLARNPDDTDIYFEMSFNLLPKWGGTPRALDDYIKSAAEQSRARFGLGMYARLYWSASANEFGPRLFQDSYADWDKMKQGFEDLETRYPGNTGRLNGYAHMACLAKDKPTFLKLLPRLDGKIDTSQWGKNPERSVELCRRWATQS